MTEEKDNKLSAIKLPDALRRELKREVNARFERGEKEPTFGDLLTEAWSAYKRNPDANRAIKIPSLETEEESTEVAASSISGNPRFVIKLTHDEIPWVEKLLKVLRSGQSEFLSAVTSNLQVFAAYCEIGNGGDDGPTDSVSTQTKKPSPTSGSARASGAAPGRDKNSLREKVAGLRQKNAARKSPGAKDKLG